jgi:hypothetical protein
MSVNTVSKDQFKQFVAALIQSDQRVVGVQAKGDRFVYDDLKNADALRLDYDVTILSPRKYMLPQKETLLQFKVGGDAQSVQEGGPMVLLGVHPYDMHAINQMDELFSQGEYDAHYMCRRQQITVIACDVVTPSENVFAASMNTATVKHGFDILLTDIGDSYLVEVAGDKGKALMRLMGDARCLEEKRTRPHQARPRKQTLLLAQAAGEKLQSPRLGRKSKAVLFLRLLQPGLPDVLLLRRTGRGQLGPENRQPLPRLGRLPAGKLRHRRRRTQLPQKSR